MLIERPPLLYRICFPHSLWRMPSVDGRKRVFLTFDDGPIPEVTPWVLEQLRERDIRATFFCVGENVWRHPQIFQQVLSEGHAVGNHTYHHLQGILTPTEAYLEDVHRANRLIQSPLMRPPHGHLRWSQLALLTQKYSVVMWDLVTRDYSKRVTPLQVLDNVKQLVRDGSIIVFHDSLKAEANLRYALPRALDYLLEEGYSFELIPGGRVQPQATPQTLTQAL